MPRVSRPRLIKAAAVALMAAAFFTFYLWIVNATGFMPRCPVKWSTGWDCPGCGSQRAFMALLHGHPMAALRANLILPLAMAYLAVMLLSWLMPDSRRLKRLADRLTSPAALLVLAAILLAWMPVRNILGI